MDIIEKKYLINVIKNNLPIYFAENFRINASERRKKIDLETRRYDSDLGAYNYLQILNLTKETSQTAPAKPRTDFEKTVENAQEQNVFDTENGSIYRKRRPERRADWKRSRSRSRRPSGSPSTSAKRATRR